MKFACIIPARSNSKRIPNKNIKKINKIPLIGHVIKILKNTQLSNNIFVSTDSPKIKKISEKFGANVPFLRSNKLSGDNVSTLDVVRDAIVKLQKYGLNFDLIFVIYPTSIFLKKKMILESIKSFKNSKSLDYFLAIKKYEHPISRAYYIKNGYLKFINNKNYRKKTQNSKDYFYDAGQMFVGRTTSIIKKKKFKNSKIAFYKLGLLESIDIDYPEDLKNVKKIFKLKKINN